MSRVARRPRQTRHDTVGLRHTRRIARVGQDVIGETKRSLIEMGLDVGYKNPSHFWKSFGG